jgi:hypothetical protein
MVDVVTVPAVPLAARAPHGAAEVRYIVEASSEQPEQEEQSPWMVRLAIAPG